MPTAKEYMEGLLKTAGVADDKRQAALAVLEDQDVAKAFEEELVKPRLRQDEFSRQMDALAAEKKKNTDWYAQELQKYNQVLAYEEELKAKLAANPDGNPNPAPMVSTPADVITKKDFEDRLKQQESQYLSLLKGVGDITSDYVTRFGKKPDLDAIERIAVEKGLPLRQAYDVYIDPLVQEQSKLATENTIKTETDKRVREELAKRNLPVDTKPREHHVIFDRAQPATPVPGRPDERALRAGFMEEWNKTSATSG